MLCHVTHLLGRIRVPARYAQTQSAGSRLVCLGLVYPTFNSTSLHLARFVYLEIISGYYTRSCLLIHGVSGTLQVYCRPTYEYFEMKLCDIHQSRLSMRNLSARFCITLVYNVLLTLLAALLPFFGDFVALVGAVGFIPMDFILPLLMWLRVRKPHTWWVWTFNLSILIFYTIVGVVSCVGAIRSIHIHVTTYKVFADL